MPTGGRFPARRPTASRSAAFPDVCLSPPTPPAGPVPIPYPNTGMASDTGDGSKTVQISGQEVMLKDSSSFQKSTGDEAATKSLGMNVITHQITGKVYFTSWSMDVKIEGENAVRHLDLMTHNHMSQPGGTPPWPYADRMAMAAVKECDDERDAVKKACDPWNEKTQCPNFEGVSEAKQASLEAKAEFGDGSDEHEAAKETVGLGYDQFAEQIRDSDCHTALRCVLSPYDPSKCCKPGQTPHHVVEGASFLEPPDAPKQPRNARRTKPGWGNYDIDAAPCVFRRRPQSIHGDAWRVAYAAKRRRAACASWRWHLDLRTSTKIREWRRFKRPFRNPPARKGA